MTLQGSWTTEGSGLSRDMCPVKEICPDNEYNHGCTECAQKRLFAATGDAVLTKGANDACDLARGSDMKSTCIRCKFYKIEDAASGYCRVEAWESGNRNSPNKMVRPDDSCAKWVDCGQQYYIRVGWLRTHNSGKPEQKPQ